MTDFTRTHWPSAGAALIIVLLGYSPQFGFSQTKDDELAAATQQVAQFHAALLTSMRSGEDFTARVELLRPEVIEFLDVPSIARICLGRTWRGLEPAAKAEFTQVLGELIVATYADRFDGFSGQAFVTQSAQAAGSGLVVKTLLERPNDDPVRLDYYFRRGQAFNVVADGVSDLSLRRADYNAIVKEQGYAALLAHMRTQREGFEQAAEEDTTAVAEAGQTPQEVGQAQTN